MTAAKSHKHILVTGPHRSGTTWVGKTIALHNSVRYVQEPFNVSRPNPELDLSLKIWFTHAPTSPQFKEITYAFDRLFRRNLFSVTRRLFSSLVKKEARSPGRSVRQTLSRYFLKPRILVKDPIAIFSAGWLYREYGLKMVCLTRSPLGFVGSLKKANWNYDFSDMLKQRAFLETRLKAHYPSIKFYAENPGDIIEHGCQLWKLFHHIILKYRDQHPTWYFVKYEEIAVDPINEFKKIFRYLNLEMNDVILSQIVKYTSSKNRSDTDTTAFGPRNARGSLTTWKRRLTHEETDRILKVTAPVAKHFYSLSEMVL